jgi:hypothetical protein
MCFGSSPEPAPPPPPPPAPPPVLEQSAPATSAPKQAETLDRRAVGTKKYRTSSLGIASDTANTGSGGSGLGITM